MERDLGVALFERDRRSRR
ncbi:hypothetical protein [Streptomyces sp. KL116D]